MTETRAWCGHEFDELDDDEHLANCLHDPAAAWRIEQAESQWDLAGGFPW